MSDQLDITKLDETEPIALGDKIHVEATHDYFWDPSLFSGTPDAQALRFAQSIQEQLYARGIATIRTLVQGFEVVWGSYRFTVELEVIDPHATVETGSNGTQALAIGSISMRGAVTSSVWAVAIAALAVVFIAYRDNVTAIQRTAAGMLGAPELVPVESSSPLAEIRDALIAAGVITIFYFLIKASK